MERRMIKFPLKMKNGAEVRNLEELKENADVQTIAEVFFDGRLKLWCDAYGYNLLKDSEANDINKTFKNVIGNLGLKLDNVYCNKLDILYFGSMGTAYLDCSEKKYKINDNHRILIEWVKVGEKEEDIFIITKKTFPTIVRDNINGNVHPVSVSEYVTYFYRYFSDKEKQVIFTKLNNNDLEMGLHAVKKNECLKFGVEISNDDPIYAPIHLGMWINKRVFHKHSEWCKVYEKEKLNCYTKEELNYNNSNFSTLKVGDTFFMGRYEDSPIEWKVLYKMSNELFVISFKTLCKLKFDNSTSEWNESNLRNWLNNNFYDESFSTLEKRFITDKVAYREIAEDLNGQIYLDEYTDDNFCTSEVSEGFHDCIRILTDHEGRIFNRLDKSLISNETSWVYIGSWNYGCYNINGNKCGYLCTQENDKFNCGSPAHRPDELFGIRPVFWLKY